MAGYLSHVGVHLQSTDLTTTGTTNINFSGVPTNNANVPVRANVTVSLVVLLVQLIQH